MTDVHPKAAARVVRAMELEIHRQVRTGQLAASVPDSHGRVRVEGTLDLASFALVTELAIREHFG